MNDREVQKNTHIKSKGQCKDKISVSRVHMFFHALCFMSM